MQAHVIVELIRLVEPHSCKMGNTPTDVFEI